MMLIYKVAMTSIRLDGDLLSISFWFSCDSGGFSKHTGYSTGMPVRLSDVSIGSDSTLETLLLHSRRRFDGNVDAFFGFLKQRLSR